MRLILLLILFVPFTVVNAFKTAPEILHGNGLTTSLKTQQVPLDTNTAVWHQNKPLRYYQYVKYLKTGKYTITSRLSFTNGKLIEGRKD